MSSATHSEGQVSTATGSSSSSTSTSSSPIPTHDRTDHTSSVLFSFLIVFLSVFGVCMVAGIVVHYVTARWRQLLSAELENIKQSRLQRQKPEMWDVQADLSASPTSQRKWETLKPLSVQVDALSSNDNVHADEHLTRPPRSLTATLAMQLMYDVIFLRPLAVPSDVAERTTPPAPTVSIPTPGTDMHVAVVIAMPSCRHRTSIPRDSLMEMDGGEPEVLCEYAIGTTRTSVQSP